jgi:transposase
VTQWKSQMIDSASEVFEQGRGRYSQEQAAQIREERLERKIGQLVVEVDWLSKKCKELGIDP